jgi:hypothetical protein
MNWYKTAQEYPPIAIASYNSYGELVIIFNGMRRYVYTNIVPDNYNKIKSLLDNKNYTAAQKLLSVWGTKNKETEEDREEMLTELYDRGYLK